jgi:hypothetical protein
MTEQLRRGDKVELRYGPFVAIGEVVEVTDIGASVQVQKEARYVGFEHPTVAPSGRRLATENYDFIGRAHWHEVTVLP